jgi:hypothetical protein
MSQPGSPVANRSQSRRGFFGRIKDKAIGTKEEREERRRREQEVSAIQTSCVGCH